MRTAVWIVMCRLPVMRCPLRGWASAYSRRTRHEAGHLLLREEHLLAAPLREPEVGHAVLEGPLFRPGRGRRRRHRILLIDWFSYAGFPWGSRGRSATDTKSAGPVVPGSGASSRKERRERPADGGERRSRARGRSRATAGPSARGSARGRGGRRSTTTARPPGRSTRAVFARARPRGRARRRARARGARRRTSRPRGAATRAVPRAARRCRTRRWRAAPRVSMAADWSTPITRATWGARAAVSGPVPQPRSATTHWGGRRARSASRVKSEP